MAVNPGSTTQDAGVTGAKQPSPTKDGFNLPLRQDRFGSVVPWYVAPTRHAFAEEGSYILATNPTVGTGMTFVTALTAFDATKPTIYISNPDQNLSLYLDFLKLICSQAATTATSIQYAIHADIVGRVFTTDNFAVIVPVNPNIGMALLTTPVVKVQNNAAASVGVAPGGTSRLVGRGTLGGLNITATELLLTFGASDASAGYVGAADAAGNPGRRAANCAPIIIPPGGSASIYLWLPGSAASINPEFELGMFAR